MPIEIANIALSRIHRIVTQERADFVAHRIPGLAGDLVQDMGRASVHLRIDGIFYGKKAKDDLDKLRNVYKDRKPVDFIADIVGQAYFSQVIIEQLEVRQIAEEQDQFSYQLTIAEYVPPPQPSKNQKPTAANGKTNKPKSRKPGQGQNVSDLDAASGGLNGESSLGGATTAGAGKVGSQLSDKQNVGKLGLNADGKLDELSNIDEIDLAENPIDAKLSDRAKKLMEVVQVPDLLDASGFDDPTKPIDSVKSKVDDSLNKAVAPAEELKTALEGDKGMVATMEAFGDSSEPIKNSVVEQLNVFKVDKVNPVQQTEKAVQGALQNADSAVQNVPIPDESCKALVNERLEEVQNNVAGQTEAIVEQSSKGVETLFQNLHQNILGDLTSVLDENKTNELSAIANDADPEAQLPAINEVAQVYANGDWKALVEAAKQRTEGVNFPEAIFRTLLKIWRAQLQHTSRSTLSPEQIDVLDDMQRRINMVSGWLDKDAKKIIANFETKHQNLAQFIDNQFFINFLNPFQAQLERAAEAVEWSETFEQFDAVAVDLEAIVAQVEQGELSESAIADLTKALKPLTTAVSKIQSHPFYAETLENLTILLEENKSKLLNYAVVSTELDPLSVTFAPFHNLFESSWLQKLIGGVEKALQHTAQFLKSLDISAITNFMHLALDKVEQGIQLIQTSWKNICETINNVTDMVTQVIELLSLENLKTLIKDIIDKYQALLFEQFAQLLRPATQFIEQLFEKIHQTLNSFSPETIQEHINDLINLVSTTLKPPAVEAAISTSKLALAGVNSELSKFSIAPISTFVVNRIQTIKSGFEIGGMMPMPASTRQRMIKSLNKLPTAQRVRTKVNKLHQDFDNIIETKAKKNLNIVVGALQKVEDTLDNYAPQKIFTSDLFKPYDDMVLLVKSMNASRLMEPVLQLFDDLIAKIEQKLSNIPIFEPLQPQLDTLTKNINRLDLTEKFKPIQAKLTEQIQFVTEKLPIKQAEVMLQFVDLIAAEVEKGVQFGETLRSKLDSINEIFAGFNNPDTHIQAATEFVMGQLNEDHFKQLATTFETSNAALDKISADNLTAFLIPTWTTLSDNLAIVVEKTTTLQKAEQAFSTELLEKLPDSDQKAALLTALTTLNELNRPLIALTTRQQNLAKAKTSVENTLSNWQVDLDENSLLNKETDTTTLLQTYIETEFKIILSPMFVSVNRFQERTAEQISQLTSVIEHFENQAKTLLEVQQHLKTTFECIKSFIDEVNNLDITFLAANWKKILDTVIKQLEAFKLKELDDFLKSCVTDMLKALRPDAILALIFPVSDPDDGRGAGLAKFDAWQAEIIADIERFDPRKILMEPLQTAFEQIKSDIVIFDVRDSLVIFLQTLENFQNELSEELEKTLTAYEELIDSIPKDMKSAVGKSASTD